MKKSSLLACTAALAVFAACNRSGMIDSTGSATTASTSSSAGSPASSGGGNRTTSTASKNSVPDRISHGQEVEVKDHAVAGKTTIFDFTSEYCPPCRSIAPHLHQLHQERADIVVVEVDINRPGVEGIDWDSPVARQYALHSIPAFRIYGPNGQLQAEGDAASSQVYGMLH